MNHGKASQLNGIILEASLKILYYGSKKATSRLERGPKRRLRRCLGRVNRFFILSKTVGYKYEICINKHCAMHWLLDEDPRVNRAEPVTAAPHHLQDDPYRLVHVLRYRNR